MSAVQPEPRSRHGRSEQPLSPLPWLLAALAVVVVAFVVVGLGRGWFRATTFDDTAVQRGVARVLTDSGYAVGPVSCPADQRVDAGRRFTCHAVIDGDVREVVITVRTEDGVYEVDVAGS